MASRLFRKILGLNLREVRVSGSFAPQGTGAPQKVAGNGWAVSRSGVGVYVITVDDRYSRLIAALSGARVADGTPTIVQFGDYDKAARTIQVRTLQGVDPALADMAADADNTVNFELVFSNTKSG